MQPDRTRSATHWRQAAEQDLRIARLLGSNEPNAACFHAQQSAEKAVKALLVMRSGDNPRLHVTAELLHELEEANVSVPDDVRRAAVSLDRYDIPTRYPDAMGNTDVTSSYFREDADHAIVAAERTLAWVDQLIVSESNGE